MIHSILIYGHALAGVIAFAAGCCALSVPASPRSSVFRIYYCALLSLLILMVAVIGYDWAGLSVAPRIAYVGLIVLGGYTLWRAHRARRVLIQRPDGWKRRYVDHVGFTLITLFDGFTIVAAIDIGAPAVIVAGVAVLGVVAGILVINRVTSSMRLPAN